MKAPVGGGAWRQGTANASHTAGTDRNVRNATSVGPIHPFSDTVTFKAALHVWVIFPLLDGVVLVGRAFEICGGVRGMSKASTSGALTIAETTSAQSCANFGPFSLMGSANAGNIRR